MKEFTCFMILLMIITSCYSTVPLRMENVRQGDKVTVHTHDGEVYHIGLQKVTADTLYGRDQRNITKPITIPVKNVKEIEEKDINVLLSSLVLFAVAVALLVLLSPSKENLKNDAPIDWPFSKPGMLKK